MLERQVLLQWEREGSTPFCATGLVNVNFVNGNNGFKHGCTLLYGVGVGAVCAAAAD